MATRDGAKKWLRRAIESGRVIRPRACQYCDHPMPQGAMAYQPDITKPWIIFWCCHSCIVNAVNTRGGLPAELYSTKELVKRLMQEAERAMKLRQAQLDAGLITAEQAREDEDRWDQRVSAAQRAYADEMGMNEPRMVSVEGVKKQVEEIEEKGMQEEEKDVFDLI